MTDPGFGSYWTVNLDAPPGTKRPRKRGRPAGKDGVDEPQPPPRKRGRPPKNAVPAPHPESPSIATLHPPDRSLRTCQVSSVRTNAEDDEEEMMTPEDSEGSDCDDYESEAAVVPPNHSSSMAGLNSFNMQPPPSAPRHHMVGFSGYDHPSIEALHNEITGLRRQASEAVSVSLRLSDQLADAQAETSRCKSSLRTAEGMLEDETRRRKEAERIADEEGRLRRAAEDALRLLRMQWPNSSRPPA